MFLSRLVIDVGDNPDRPRPGRLWLRNLYHVHQRLCMAFPSDPRLERDPEFLAPYDPCDFPEQRHLADKRKTEVDADILKQVHAKRNVDSGFLFRIDPLPGGRAMILVQSAIPPDWCYAFQNVSFLTACEVKPYDPCFTKGKSYRFRLVANPTHRLSRHSLGLDDPARSLTQDEVDQFFEEARRRAQKQGLPQMSERGHIITILRYSCGHEERYDCSANRNPKRLFFEAQRACPDCRKQKPKRQEPVKEEWIGSRVPVRNENLIEWLACQGKKKGFFVDKENTEVQPGYIYVHKKKSRDDKGQRLRTVRYDGILQVTDADRLRDTVIRGLGPGKAYGLGLLSLTPPRGGDYAHQRPAHSS
jgi:hypothetical protein